MPHRAVVIGNEGWMTARALEAWLASGQEVAEAWCCGAETSLLRPRRVPAAVGGGWSARALLARHRIPVRACPPLAAWADARNRAVVVGADVLLSLLSVQIVPTALLDHFGGRALNVHPALLPRYRGRVPRLAMLLDGTASHAGGVTLHVLTAGIDEGPIVGQRAVPYLPARGYVDWDARLAEAAGDLMATAAVPYLDGRLAAVPQDATQASYRRAAPGELEICAATPLAGARRLGAAIGATGRLVCRPEMAARRSYRVTGVDRVLGPATGRAARIGVRTVELDVADARVRLRRRSPLDRARAGVAAVAARIRAPAARRASA